MKNLTVVFSIDFLIRVHRFSMYWGGSVQYLRGWFGSSLGVVWGSLGGSGGCFGGVWGVFGGVLGGI